jgi:hypothetical protein
MKHLSEVVLLCGAVLGTACSSSLDAEEATALGTNSVSQALEEGSTLYTYVDMMRFELRFYNPDTDQEALVDLRTLPGYGNGVPLHTFVLDGGHKVYVSFIGNESNATGFAVIHINGISWEDQTANVELDKLLLLDAPAAPNTFPPVEQVVPEQPIQPWASQTFSQLHGPTGLPSKNRVYWTVLTDDRVVAIDTETDELVPVQTFGDQSNYLHGVSFNPSETRGLAASYWYDRGFITNFKVKSNGDLRKKGKLWLGKKKRHGAYSHNVEWLDDRYALAGSMQFGPTSLTPAGTKILGPGVWLLDAEKRTSVQIIGTAASADDPGVFRSASWLETVGDRLFIGEEDSLDATFGEDGYVSVFDPWSIRR